MDASQFPQCQRHEWIFCLDTLFHPHCLACEDKLGKHENWHSVMCLPATKLHLNPSKIFLLARLDRNRL